MGADVAAEEQFGPYLVYERLGVGGMATVHRALERGIEGFERIVALKRLLPHLAEDASFIKSFVREAKLASMLNHVNIVQIFELGRVGTEYFISMEHIDGRDIRRLLRHARKVTGPPPIHVIVGLLLQLCDALDYAHTKADELGQPLRIVHRDVSPSNLLITSAGHLKVIDFGIARAQSVQLRTQTGRVKGKLAYMAPEAIAGKDLDARSDLFAAGVIAHELLTARPLFARKTEYETLLEVQRGDIAPPSAHNAACPPELDAIVMRALARDPDERYADASAFRDALLDLRRRFDLQTGARDIALWMEWAESVEAPTTAIEIERPSGARRAPTPTPRPRKEDDEAVEIAWGGGNDSNQAIVLEDVPDVSEKHVAPSRADLGLPPEGEAWRDSARDAFVRSLTEHDEAAGEPAVARPESRETVRAAGAPHAGARAAGDRAGDARDAVPGAVSPRAETRPTPTPTPRPTPPPRLTPPSRPTPPPRLTPTPRPSPGRPRAPRRTRRAPRRSTTCARGARARAERAAAAHVGVAPADHVRRRDRRARGGQAPPLAGARRRGRGGRRRGRARRGRDGRRRARAGEHARGGGAAARRHRAVRDRAPDADIKIEGHGAHAGSPWSTQLAAGPTTSTSSARATRRGRRRSSSRPTRRRRCASCSSRSARAPRRRSASRRRRRGSTPCSTARCSPTRRRSRSSSRPGRTRSRCATAASTCGATSWSRSRRSTTSSTRPRASSRAARPAPTTRRTSARAPRRASRTRPSPTRSPTRSGPTRPGPTRAIRIPHRPRPARRRSRRAWRSRSPRPPRRPSPPSRRAWRRRRLRAPPPPPAPAPKPRPTEPVLVAPAAVKRLSGSTPSLAASRRAELPATVSAKVCIDTAGRVTSVDVLTKLERMTLLDLTSALREWRYAPYVQAGAAVPACFVVSFRAK